MENLWGVAGGNHDLGAYVFGGRRLFSGDALAYLWHHESMKASQKASPEGVDGPEATGRFDALVRRVLAVPHEEIMRREAEYRRQSIANPHRRGPKPKATPSALDREEDAL